MYAFLVALPSRISGIWNPRSAAKGFFSGSSIGSPLFAANCNLGLKFETA
jgi:hypothetical protein